MNLLELALEPEIYCPIVNETGNYIDKIPALHLLKNGIRCPCGTRQDKSYNTNMKFTSHIKTKKHQAWLSELNVNKLNYYEENIKLNDTVHQQRKIIAEFEKKVKTKELTIEYLTQQLYSKSYSKTNNNIQVGNLIDFN
jgi:hypothetical protein